MEMYDQKSAMTEQQSGWVGVTWETHHSCWRGKPNSAFKNRHGNIAGNKRHGTMAEARDHLLQLYRSYPGGFTLDTQPIWQWATHEGIVYKYDPEGDVYSECYHRRDGTGGNRANWRRAGSPGQIDRAQTAFGSGRHVGQKQQRWNIVRAVRGRTSSSSTDVPELPLFQHSNIMPVTVTRVSGLTYSSTYATGGTKTPASLVDFPHLANGLLFLKVDEDFATDLLDEAETYEWKRPNARTATSDVTGWWGVRPGAPGTIRSLIQGLESVTWDPEERMGTKLKFKMRSAKINKYQMYGGFGQKHKDSAQENYASCS